MESSADEMEREIAAVGLFFLIAIPDIQKGEKLLPLNCYDKHKKHFFFFFKDALGEMLKVVYTDTFKVLLQSACTQIQMLSSVDLCIFIPRASDLTYLGTWLLTYTNTQQSKHDSCNFDNEH